MQLTKVSKIGQIHATQGLFEITLVENPLVRDFQSVLKFDQATLAHLHIPLSLELIGRTLICTCKSRSVFYSEDEYHYTLTPNDVGIRSLSRHEEISWLLRQLSPEKRLEKYLLLKLGTFSGGGSISLEPVPYYEIVMELTNDEYAECRALPPATVFSVTFSLE